MKKSTKGVEPVRHLRDDRIHWVYYLPEEHYVGVSSQINPRFRIYKQRQLGMNTDGYKILKGFKTREDARHYENLWHSWLGANGINLNS